METWTEVIDRVITNENEEHSSEIEESTTKLDSETSITNNLECTASGNYKHLYVNHMILPCPSIIFQHLI